jgi:acetyltransferase
MTQALLLPATGRRYPSEAVEVRPLADGRPLLVRPLAARDRELLQDFVRGLSPTARYQRFQGGIRELSPAVLTQLMDVDYHERMALVAVVSEDGRRRIIGEARYAPALDGAGAAEFALAVADAWQRHGIGQLLFGRLLRYAARNGVARMQGDVLHGNAAMLGLARRFGFSARLHPDGAWLTRVERRLDAPPIAAPVQAATSSFQSSLPPEYTATSA